MNIRFRNGNLKRGKKKSICLFLTLGKKLSVVLTERQAYFAELPRNFNFLGYPFILSSREFAVSTHFNIIPVFYTPDRITYIVRYILRSAVRCPRFVPHFMLEQKIRAIRE